MSENIHKNFDKFFKDPTYDNLCDLLFGNFGEIGKLYDFKSYWQSLHIIAKHILGFSNSGGGAIIIGVRQNSDNTFSISGLDRITDHQQIDQGVKKYVPDQLEYEILDFIYPDVYKHKDLIGKKIQVIIIKDQSNKSPYVSSLDSPVDNKGRCPDIKKGTVYIRRHGSTEAATNEELQQIVDNRCTETSSSEYLKSVTDEWKYIYRKDIIIEKGKNILIEEFRTRLLSITDSPMVVTIEISIPNHFRKKVSFSDGAYILEEKYVIDIYSISKDPDKVRLKLGDLKFLTKKEMSIRYNKKR